jgi:hypothetical protein
MTQFPHVTHTIKGGLLFLAGLILFLYVTNIITLGLQMIILLASIILMIFGIIEMDAYNKLKKLVNQKK